ncbi:MAG: winged helix DNA-binding domain-containing protein [Acidobacteria bacterium]|nr:winged helix DNA-binding domain-containing protein [Acidobacteriota bacterium]
MRSNRLRYALWHNWLPTTDPFALSETDARRALVTRYVNAYGPVTIPDLAWWTGWTTADANAAADGIGLSVSGDAANLLGGVRLLPTWDVHMVAHKDRSHIIDDRHVRFAYDAKGNAASVVTRNGRVIGIWDLGKKDEPLHIRVAPLTTWKTSMWDSVEAQIDKIRVFLNQPDVTIERCTDAVDLTTAKKNQHLYPLSE